jgi:hypothetical protein
MLNSFCSSFYLGTGRVLLPFTWPSHGSACRVEHLRGQDTHSPVCPRIGEDFPTVSRAREARRAVAGRRSWIVPRAERVDRRTADTCPSPGRRRWDRAALGSGCLPLALPGHVGAVAHATPRPTAGTSHHHESALARVLQDVAIPPAPHHEASQDRGQGRSLRSRRCAMPRKGLSR